MKHFPYARRKLESYLRNYSTESEIESVIQQLHLQHKAEEGQGLQLPQWIDIWDDQSRLRLCVEYCKWLMAKDSKATTLKYLEGKVWQEGYANGELYGQVYPDVPPAFKRWRKREICIYSSGSILAQQLLFRSTAYGDMTPLFSAFFDTHIGAKTDMESYRKIAKPILRIPRNILFISDSVKEVTAALDTGMQALLCYRDAQSSGQQKANTLIHGLDEVFPD